MNKMNHSITLPNGELFQRFYGGVLVTGERLTKLLSNERVAKRLCGEYSTIRDYRHVDLIIVEGVQLVQVGKTMKEFYTLCGNYKIVNYGKSFNVFECVIWRKNLNSTFGNYARGVDQDNHSLTTAIINLKKVLK